MPTSTSTGPHLQASNVTAGYNDTPVIKGVSLAVGRGEVATVIGPNGAGKSTLVKAILGVVKPMEGSVILAGTHLEGRAADEIARNGVGYVPQVRDVFETLSVRENLEMGGYQLPRREVAPRINEVLEAFPALGGMLGRSAGNLSGGERKMVAMGRVLMTRPSLVILDEPTAGLSPKLADVVLARHVRTLAERNVAIVLVEQRAKDALAISDRAYVMASGEVVLASDAAVLMQRKDLGRIFLGQTAGGK